MSSKLHYENVESTSDPKARLSTLTQEEFSALKNEQRLEVIQSIKSIGWLNIFYGTFIVWFIWTNRSGNFIEIVHLLGGITQIVQGIWAIFAPSLRIILFASIVMFLSGLLLIWVAVSDSFVGFAVILGIIGASQIWNAFRVYRTYNTHKSNPLTQFDMHILRLRDAARNKLNSSNLKHDGDLIEFYLKRERWRAWLLGKKVVLTPRYKKKLIITDRENFRFAPDQPDYLDKKKVMGVFGIEGVVAWGPMRQLSLERFMQWKPVDKPDSDFASSYRHANRISRLVAKIALGSATLLVGFLLLMALFGIVMAATYYS